MKLTLILVVLVIVGIAAAFAAPPEQTSTSKPLGVDDFMKHVDDHKGEVTIEGIVSAVSESDNRVALIDVAEFERCKDVTCAQYTLPVQWSGELPAVEDKVLIRGKIETTDGKLVFVGAPVAKSIPVVCALTPDDSKERKELLAKLGEQIVERREINDGLSFRFKPSDDLLARLGKAIDMERQCCRFLTFRLTVEPDDGPVWLELTGPAGTRDILNEYFPTRSAQENAGQ